MWSDRHSWVLLPLALACSPARDTNTAKAASDTAARAANSSQTSADPAAAVHTGNSKIDDARSAAPPSIAKNATIMDWPDSEGGKPKELRHGSNGWTCFPSSPVTTGAAGKDPMCLDKEFVAWGDAWMSHKSPRVKNVGIGYMLQGDIGASNTDPYAKGPTANNHWVRSGPHVMVIAPTPVQLEGMSTEPTNGGPWVMWKGTPYAHVMVPAQ